MIIKLRMADQLQLQSITPTKSNQKRQYQTTSFSNEPQLQQPVDYKAKTFKLMRQIAQLQVRQKKSQSCIRDLQKQVQAHQRQTKHIFELLGTGTGSYQDCFRRISELQSGSNPPAIDEVQVVEWANIIQQYKKIINTQQYKFIKLEQQCKIAQMKAKKYQQQKSEYQKEMELKEKEKELKESEMQAKEKELGQVHLKCKSLQSEVIQLKRELKILKQEYKKAIIEKEKIQTEKDKIQEMYEINAAKFNQQIEHFSELENSVEARLIQVEKEMTEYRAERQSHLQKIALLQNQLRVREEKEYFSFGGTANIAIQTDQSTDYGQSNLCLQVSIRTLLQQNQRLKNALYLLYKRENGEQLPKQVELQLKILTNMKESQVVENSNQNTSTNMNINSNMNSILSAIAFNQTFSKDKLIYVNQKEENKGEIENQIEIKSNTFKQSQGQNQNEDLPFFNSAERDNVGSVSGYVSVSVSTVRAGKQLQSNTAAAEDQKSIPQKKLRKGSGTITQLKLDQSKFISQPSYHTQQKDAIDQQQ